jgi:tetratricopeptide (TPR) repeat protein
MFGRAPLTAVATFVALHSFVLGAGSATADSARDRARTKLAEGAQLYDAGDFPAALKRYEEAYALVPSPKILYNFGLVYQGMGRKAEALASFERFLAEARDVEPNPIKTARDCVDRLRKEVAWLEIGSDLAGAEVSLSGRHLGVLPLREPVAIDPGQHDLILRKDGLAPVLRRLTAAAGQSLRIELAAPDSEPAPETRRSPPSSAPAEAMLPRPSSEDTRTTERDWQPTAAWISLAAAAAGVGFGVYETIAFTGHRRDFEDLKITTNLSKDACGVEEPNHGRDPLCATYYDETQRALWLSVTGYAAAAVLGGVSLWLFRSSPHASSDVAWGCASQGLGATCRFAF